MRPSSASATSKTDVPVRRTGRVSKPPARFVPGKEPLPVLLETMIRDIASAATKKEGLAFDVDAVSVLEQVLQVALKNLLASAYAHAQSKGRESIEKADLDAACSVLQKFKTSTKK